MRLITKFLEFSLPLKILTSAFIGSLAGSGLLYFVVEYETYFYVLSKGIRLPFEGVQYLSASVALLGIVIAICATTAFLITRFLLMLITNKISQFIKDVFLLYNNGLKEIKGKSNFFKSIEFSEIQDRIENLSFKEISVILFIIYWTLYFIIGLFNPIDKVALKYILMFVLTVTLLSLWRRSFSWFVSAMIVIFVYFTFIKTILDFEKYEIFLQAVGYGGGLPIRVQYKDTKEFEDIKLIIRTKKYLLTSKNKSNEYEELPIENIRKFIYLENDRIEKYILKALEPYAVKKSPTENTPK